jgi:3-dehydroquinate synthase
MAAMSERVFLSGPMGSGKSAVGACLAELRGADFIDLDERIQQRAGKSIAAIFAEQGEPAFRALERATVLDLLDANSRCVVALGGGTVLDAAVRRRLLREGTLITLQASVATLAARVEEGEGRPLLSGQDVRARLTALLAERAEMYAECHARVDTADRALTDIAREIDAIASDRPVVVPLGLRTYCVEIGAGIRHGIARRAGEAARGQSVLLVTDGGAEEPWARQARTALEDANRTVIAICLAPGEEHKNIASIEQIWDAALDAGIDRDALVVAVGGGVVGDMAAFAASTLLRGLAFGQLPTTLLSMVDSAVGGKTGIDRRQGKNLVGTFHQPRFVLCDVETLTTLPLAERRAGLAEVVKSAWLDGEKAVASLEHDAELLVDGDIEATLRAVRMSVALKAKIVTEDEREAGVRATLNLGHTIGHAIEAAAGFGGLRHGEAVSLGMVAAFRLAARLRGSSGAELNRVTALLSRLGLPVDLDRHLDPRTLSFISADKKKTQGKVRFIVPGAPGEMEIVLLDMTEISELVRA